MLYGNNFLVLLKNIMKNKINTVNVCQSNLNKKQRDKRQKDEWEGKRNNHSE